MQNISHDLGFISCQGANCGLTTCSRNAPHFHCRICGFGTSQVGNVVAHARLCTDIELSQKDYSSVTTCSESIYQPSTQPFSYYPPVSQPSASSKIITNQSSSMFNFVIPPQNSQFGGLYGPQTVFPNPNLFSPSSFTNFSQIDSSWTSRLLTVHPPGSSPSDGSLKTSNSPNCCRLETNITSSPDKLGLKEAQGQNWYCGQQLVQQKSDSTTSCSISLLLLEQTKESEECINVDDLCFNSKSKELPARSSCMQVNAKNKESSGSSSEESDIVVEESESEVSAGNDENSSRCLICHLTPTSHRLININDKAPTTNFSQTLILQIVVKILNQIEHRSQFICNSCLDLINLVDSLEVKLASTIGKLRKLYENNKEKKTMMKTESNDDAFTCRICDITFSTSTFLAKHKQYHTKLLSYCCEFCGKGFPGLRKLEKHILLHSKTLRFQCELCGKQFLEKHTLTNHIRQHKGEHKYFCSLCQKGFVQKSVFKSHLHVHSDQYFVCHHCGRKVKTYSNLIVHMKICSGDLKYSCDKCSKKFPIKSLLEKHILFDHKSKFKFICPICQKGFWKESDLLSHSTTHSEEKPFKCSTCGNCYKSKKNLTHHSRIHGNSPEFKCATCHKEFTRGDALADHMNQHTGNKPYQCQVCWKKFANRINFNVHVKRHSNVSGVKTVSRESEQDQKDVNQVNNQQDKKCFSCDKCSQMFAFKNSLNKHKKSKHGILKNIKNG